MFDTILNNIGAAFIQGKDRALAELVKYFANRFALSRYGEIHDIGIDSHAKEICFELRLKGETEPLDVRASYRMERMNGKICIVLENISTSREWVNLLLADWGDKLPLQAELPPAAAIAAGILGL